MWPCTPAMSIMDSSPRPRSPAGCRPSEVVQSDRSGSHTTPGMERWRTRKRNARLMPVADFCLVASRLAGAKSASFSFPQPAPVATHPFVNILLPAPSPPSSPLRAPVRNSSSQHLPCRHSSCRNSCVCITNCTTRLLGAVHLVRSSFSSPRPHRPRVEGTKSASLHEGLLTYVVAPVSSLATTPPA